MTIRKLAASTAIAAVLSAGVAYAQSADKMPEGDELTQALNKAATIQATSTETRKVNGEVVETTKKTTETGGEDADPAVAKLDVNAAAKAKSVVAERPLEAPLSMGDATIAAREEFVAADADDDGVLSQTEYMTLAASQEQRLATISSAAESTMTAEADSAEDVTTTPEMMEAEGEMHAELPEGAYGEGDLSYPEDGHPVPEATGLSAEMKATAKAQFEKLSNGKSAVTMTALLDERRDNFDAADANADGILQKDELTAYYELNAGLKSRA